MRILITGVSSGLGRAMASALLAGGHTVVGTVRTEDARLAFERLAPGRASGRELHLDRTASIAPLVASIERELGPIDALINNAGYGHEGVVEELTAAELEQQLAINVVAPILLCQAVLPFMRTRGRGRIVNVTSMGASVAFPGLGAYHASKFALQGLSLALAAEVERFGVHVTALQPGLYRSDWNDRSKRRSPRSLDAYDWVFDERPALSWGDPAALGAVVATLLTLDPPPRELLVGPTAVRLVRDRLRDQSAAIDRWAALSHADGEG